MGVVSRVLSVVNVHAIAKITSNILPVSHSPYPTPRTPLPTPHSLVPLSPKEPEKPAGQEARQTYLVFARGVIGEPSVDYTTLYQRFAPNDWAALKLDDGVALAALQSGYAAKAVVGFLHQSPYVQHQIHAGQVPVATMTQYAKATVQKVMQALHQTQTTQRQTRQGQQTHRASPRSQQGEHQSDEGL